MLCALTFAHALAEEVRPERPTQGANAAVAAKAAERRMEQESFIGKPAISFEAKTLDGKSVRFPGDFKGRLVMLDFWAT